MGFASALKKFDIYRDIPRDLTEQTLTGAIVSILCGIFIFYLFISEFLTYLTIETVSEMYVARDHGNTVGSDDHATITINMNITVPKMPCALTSVDVQDIMGSHVVDYGGLLHKYRTDANGQIKFDSLGYPFESASASPMDQQGEGCNIQGHVIVKRVPGNFHISAHAHAELVGLYFPGSTLNCTHYVHSLYFGDNQALTEVDEAMVAPLNGGKKIAIPEPEDSGAARSYEYYIKVVPTKYSKYNGETYDSYQYVASSNHILGRFQMPAIYFRYDFSPITVQYTQTKTGFAHFIVQVCAIIGGVFTVLGLVNQFAVASVKKLKADMNKLG